ncbi:hypothetical protein PIB30_002705 [Stylosanthes scabra]|uniref:F-box domain-containing protein n=1 Tax=Stylosanthes scabra TaxID=79078 RepID=A0ABU6R3S4_9FABA|nr:hypothetical protein [Stylosanthes scabra]
MDGISSHTIKKRKMDMISGRTTKKRNLDRISALPDSVLRHILSFLPTKTAVSTSVLSRRWRYLWQHLRDFDFDLDLEQNPEEYDEEEAFMFFAEFISQVLARRRDRDTHTFRLSCSYNTDEDLHCDRFLNDWIHSVIGPHLQQFHVFLYPDPIPDSTYSDPSPCYNFPAGIFSCSSLVSLTLDGLISIENISSVRLPALRTLKVCIDGALRIDKILSGCPVLEELTLDFIVRNVSPKIIVPNSLKRLKIDTDCRFPSFTHMRTRQEVEIEIDTPALEYLSVSFSNSVRGFTVNNLHNVVDAWLDVRVLRYKGADHLLRLLKALDRAKCLQLSCSTMQLILCAPTFEFPKFNLRLRVPCFNSSLMINLLHNCPALKVFKIYNSHWKVLFAYYV